MQENDNLIIYKNKKEKLEPIFFKPDKYVSLSVDNVINDYDVQLQAALDYINNSINVRISDSVNRLKY